MLHHEDLRCHVYQMAVKGEKRTPSTSVGCNNTSTTSSAQSSILAALISIGYASSNSAGPWCRNEVEEVARTMSNANRDVSVVRLGPRDLRAYIMPKESLPMTGIKNTGRTELNHQGTAKLDLRNAYSSWGTSIVQPPCFSVITIFETYIVG